MGCSIQPAAARTCTGSAGTGLDPGYGLLKLVGKTEGLQSKRKELAVQFKKSRRKEEAKAA